MLVNRINLFFILAERAFLFCLVEAFILHIFVCFLFAFKNCFYSSNTCRLLLLPWVMPIYLYFCSICLGSFWNFIWLYLLIFFLKYISLFVHCKLSGLYNLYAVIPQYFELQGNTHAVSTFLYALESISSTGWTVKFA